MSDCDHTDQAHAYALEVLPTAEVGSFETHLSSCTHCREELASLRPTIDAFAAWPVDVLRPPRSLQAELGRRIAADSGSEPVPIPATQWSEPPWHQVAPGIECKTLAIEQSRGLVSLLVRLAPNTDYPPHIHAGVEELHLLDGELWIDDRKLSPGDYNVAQPGTGDQRVWTETGCTCVLITSTLDELM